MEEYRKLRGFLPEPYFSLKFFWLERGNQRPSPAIYQLIKGNIAGSAQHSDMLSPSYAVDDLVTSASFAQTIRAHWKLYLMEAAELAALMFSICLFGALVYSAESPLQRFSLSLGQKSFFMGIAVAAVTCLIIRSPFGRRSGAHFNPAITVAYLWLGRIHRWDALAYIAAQFTGGVAGVFVACRLLGHHLSADPVRYVVTLPGKHGAATAFLVEFLLSAVLMGIVLFATNHRRLAPLSPVFVSLITVFYYVLCSSISGFSVNPARTFSTAFFASVWHGIWIYFAAPTLGMVAAAAIYVRSMGPGSVYCAKIFHDLHTPCPFPCRFERLHRKQ
jgi:aquaporin Z